MHQPTRRRRHRALTLAALLTPAPAFSAAVDWLPTAPTPGVFSDPANWSTGTAPSPTDAARFATGSAHTVTLTADTTTDQLLVGDDALTLDLAGHRLSTTGLTVGGSPSGSSLVVTQTGPVAAAVLTLAPNVTDTATLTVRNATVTANHAYLGSSSSSAGGIATVNVEPGGTFATSWFGISPISAINLNGGTFRVGLYLSTDLSLLHWNGGTFEVENNVIVSGLDHGWTAGGLRLGSSFDVPAGRTLSLPLTDKTILAIDGGATLSATGGQIISQYDTYVSANSTGTLLLSDDAVMTGRQIRIGSPYPAPAGTTYSRNATAVVDNSTLSLTGNAYVGGSNAGTLAVRNGGTASFKDAIVGSTVTTVGTISVDGATSSLSCSGTLTIGNTGDGTLSITNGATVSSAAAVVGSNAAPGTSGTVTASGPGTSWTNSGTLRIAYSVLSGDRPIGSISFSDHASLSTSILRLATTAQYASASLDLTANAFLNITDSAYLSSTGTIRGGPATISLTDASATVGSLLRLANTVGTSLSLTRSTLTVGTPAAPGSLDNAASITLADHSTLTLHGTLANAGTLTLSPGSSLLWDPAGTMPDPLSTLRTQLATNHILPSPTTPPNYRPAYTFSGEPTAPTSLTITLTLTGDTNFDGRINADDYALLDRGFAKSLTSAHWTDGDFNYDGIIDNQDYLLIDTALGQAQGFSPGFLSQRESQFGPAYVAALLTSIPEPSSLTYLFAGLLPLLPRRRNR